MILVSSRRHVGDHLQYFVFMPETQPLSRLVIEHVRQQTKGQHLIRAQAAFQMRSNQIDQLVRAQLVVDVFLQNGLARDIDDREHLCVGPTQKRRQRADRTGLYCFVMLVGGQFHDGFQFVLRHTGNLLIRIEFLEFLWNGKFYSKLRDFYGIEGYTIIEGRGITVYEVQVCLFQFQIVPQRDVRRCSGSVRGFDHRCRIGGLSGS